jgi:hypothetical protein
MSMDPLSQQVPWSGESKQTYDKNRVCQYLKLGLNIKYIKTLSYLWW